MKRYHIPTGVLIVDDYEKGQLETLSIGDYGKSENIKANFLGISREINGVSCNSCRPLQEKWVITLSTQFGCIMNCNFCDVPNVKWNGNVSFNDLKKQLYSAIKIFQNQVPYTDRLNIHFARMGEPILNKEVFRFTYFLALEKQKFQDETGLRAEVIHPVLTTSLPNKFKLITDRIGEWCYIKNSYFKGQAGLQFSINSTNEDQRNIMFKGLQLPLEKLAKIAEKLPNPLGRKYCLNFAYASDYIIDASLLKSMFDPTKFMMKITPMHETSSCKQNSIKTESGLESFAPYKMVEDSLIENGFDVIIFLPSTDEENGLVTCGNAVLGNSIMRSSNDIKIHGINPELIPDL